MATPLAENDSDYDSMFGDDSDDDHNSMFGDSDDNDNNENVNSNESLDIGDDRHDKSEESKEPEQSVIDITVEHDVNANPSADTAVGESSDFDDMFGSASEEEEEEISIDIQKTIIPRKRKLRDSSIRGSSPRSSAPIHSKKIFNNENNSINRKSLSTTRKRALPGNQHGRLEQRRLRPDQYKVFAMDDFWRSLRAWDFVTELNGNMKRSSHNKRASGGAPSDSDNSNEDQVKKNSQQMQNVQSLPNQFHCAEEYIAKWAPLQIKETKAQILSEFSSNRTISYQKITAPVKIMPKKVLGDTYKECLSLQIESRSAGGVMATSNSGRQGGVGGGQTEFMQNDLVLITCESSIIEQACKGILRPPDKSSYSMSSLLSMHSPFVDGRLSIIGIVANRCKGVDGLDVQVSRRLWKPNSTGPSDLYVLRLGTNVTAVREFKALCSLKEMPLTKYILSGQHETSHESKVAPTGKNGKDILSEFGGSNALGIGFRIWVKSKFNHSQQASISAAAREYGDGGFTLVKGPPGTGKTTTLTALLNALHLKQYQRYYSDIEKITLAAKESSKSETLAAISAAAEVKPRILVCAPSNAAVDNVILKIITDRFLDGNGSKYSPSIIRVGSGQSNEVAAVGIDVKVNNMTSQGSNPIQLGTIIVDTRKELRRLQNEIHKLQVRVRLLAKASNYPLAKDWEIRIDEENFEMNQRVLYVNHKTKKVQLTCPPKPEANAEQCPTDQMPHYRGCMSSLVKYIERYNDLHSKLLQLIQVQNTAKELKTSNRNQLTVELNQVLETSILDSTHIVMTTLGSAGSRTLEGTNKFSVIVIDEAAQSCEPSMLPALQLGSSHCVLVGDPQQLPATIFSMSGRETKYDRSLFQRLEEAGHSVYMLNIQYRMNPKISSFPRRIFYDGSLEDGPNVKKPDFGGDLTRLVRANFRHFQPFTILDIDSSEERDGASLSNKIEANLALHLFTTLRDISQSKVRMAVITPYQQQVALIRKIFQDKYGLSYSKIVDISTIDSFQGKESSVVILSCVRASPVGGGIGFLSDVQRMNVALTRAKHYLFVIARCDSIIINPYWRDLVKHAKEQGAVLRVPHGGGFGRGDIAGTNRGRGNGRGTGASRRAGTSMFPDLRRLHPMQSVSAPPNVGFRG